MYGIYAVVFYFSGVLGTKPLHFQWVNCRNKNAVINKYLYHRPMVISRVFKYDTYLLSVRIDLV